MTDDSQTQYCTIKRDRYYGQLKTLKYLGQIAGTTLNTWVYLTG